MNTFAFAIPIPDGRTEALRQLGAQLSGPRKADLQDSMRRFGWTKEYGWVQPMNAGDVFIMYFEGSEDFLAANKRYTNSTDPFDVWYQDRGAQILDVDFNIPLREDMVEQVYEAHDAARSGREKPQARAMIVQSGASETARDLGRQLAGPREAEAADFHNRYGVTSHLLYLQHNRAGDLLIEYVEAEDPERFSYDWPRSSQPFEQWMRGMLGQIGGVDYAEMSGPLPELVLRADASLPAWVR